MEDFMETIRVDILIDMAHSIFSDSSVYEVMDLENRQSAEDYLNKTYDYPEKEKINKYLELVESIRLV
jgi:hypothetical protein